MTKLFDRLFRPPIQIVTDDLVRDEESLRELEETQRQNLEFARSPAHARLLRRLEEESLQPMPLNDQSKLVEAAVRANVLREVRSWLITDARRAEEFASRRHEETP